MQSRSFCMIIVFLLMLTPNELQAFKGFIYLTSFGPAQKLGDIFEKLFLPHDVVQFAEQFCYIQFFSFLIYYFGAKNVNWSCAQMLTGGILKFWEMKALSMAYHMTSILGFEIFFVGYSGLRVNCVLFG